MVGKIHFISGLPRSGSTLLGALLRQNPAFNAGMSGPVSTLVGPLQKGMGNAEFSGFFDDKRRAAMLRALFDAFYADLPEGHTVFDTSRGWTGKIALLANLYPEARVICCVREVPWIIDSFERLLNKNPLQVSKMFQADTAHSVYARAEVMMDSDKGQIGLPWSTLREAWFGDGAGRLIVIPYERLAQEPQKTLQRLYADLGEPAFAHDFAHVDYDEPDFDAKLGMPGLHKVREQVRLLKREPCIPPDLFAKYAGTNFWAKTELNARGVTVY